METQTIINSALILALITTWSYVGISGLEPTHYCEDREITAYCYKLSSTNKSCYTVSITEGQKICSNGWKEIPIKIFSEKNISYDKVGIQYICGKYGCELK